MGFGLLTCVCWFSFNCNFFLACLWWLTVVNSVVVVRLLPLEFDICYLMFVFGYVILVVAFGLFASNCWICLVCYCWCLVCLIVVLTMVLGLGVVLARFGWLVLGFVVCLVCYVLVCFFWCWLWLRYCFWVCLLVLLSRCVLYGGLLFVLLGVECVILFIWCWVRV